MEHRQSENSSLRLSAAMIIARDALIFVACVLTVLLAYVISLPSRSSASANPAVAASNASIEPQQTASSDLQPTDVPEATDNLSANAPATGTPSPSPEPTPSPTPDTPAAHGDFSATFPAEDTGANALYSYQGDTTKIAINKVQSDGVTYFVADVWIKNIDAFQTALAKDSYGRGIHEMPLTIANDHHAVFAVSGDYYGAREQGVVVRDGVLYRDVMGDDVCMLKRDGTIAIYPKSEFSALSMLDSTVWQAWAFGPALVENGTACDTSNSKIKVKNPRCAIGYYEPGHYCFVVVDGRQSDYSDGMTLAELADTFVSLGCQSAYNLDGGATAMMVFQGAVISHPTNGGRSSSDIIYF